MCGIVGIFEIKGSAEQQRTKALEMSKRIRHRGPDWSGIFVDEHAIIAHERLAIVDPSSGRQPLYSNKTETWCWVSTARFTTTASSENSSKINLSFKPSQTVK